MDRCVE